MQALRVLGEQIALATGRATANIATQDVTPVLSPEEEAQLADWLDALKRDRPDIYAQAVREVAGRLTNAAAGAQPIRSGKVTRSPICTPSRPA